MKWKAFSPGSLSALLSNILQIRNKADANASALSGLGNDLQSLANRTTAALSELDEAKAEAGHTHSASEVGARPSTWTPTASDVGALPITGGTLTGNLTGKYITGTRLQTTAAGHQTTAATKISVLDASGWLYYRTPAELRGDIGAAAKPVKGSFTIPTTGWGTDSTVGYTKYYDVAVSGVTVNDRADVIIAPGSVNAAAACGLCPVSETLAGKVRIRASKVPTAAISAEYWIEKE